MSYNDFFHKLHKSQWRDNFSADSIPALYEHLVENNIPTPVALCKYAPMDRPIKRLRLGILISMFSHPSLLS